ncbi:hypothetical protein ANN_28053 [Periplaneta americana]|uniref:Uncharacterized protein n=1 Tax=Periplaneta americana TaxID=6978 RepID=A0ABQ8RUS5_PERAM|nr:hypothetical protein ANN_28053 [Periplaneta americana]
MQDHYSSYCYLKKDWGQKTDLQLWGLFSNMQFVVYTNAVVAVGDAVDTDAQNVLMTGGKCLRFSENDFTELKNEPVFNQFLYQFRLYTEQASEKALDSVIRTELLRALGTDSQFQSFLINITNWMEGPGSYLTENVEFWKQQLPEGGGFLRVQNTNVLTCLKLHQSVDKKILVDANVLEDRMSEVLAIWDRWPGCDILVIDGKTLVVIDDRENGRELKSLSHKDEFRFGQLNEESKRQVLDCKFVSGIVESIGNKLTQQSEHYIPRKFFSGELVSWTIFSDDRDCLVVSGVSLEALRLIVQPRKEVEIFDETKHSEDDICRCFVIQGKEDFEKAKSVYERVHWLHKEKTDFIWKQSKGGMSYIKPQLMDVTSDRSFQEVMQLSDKVKLLVAHPGMGKSTEVVNLAQEFKRLELLLRAGKFMSDFAKSLFKHELDHGGNIVILIDGFDEISPDYAEKDMLEEEFSYLSFELQPFTKQDQRDFLAKLWNDMSDGSYNFDIFIANVLEVTGNSLNDKLSQFTEIPLLTLMLAEVFRSKASQFCQSDKDYVVKLLSSPECDVNGKDKGGRAPLHLAVINHTETGNFSPSKTMCEIMELLLQNHCDCNVEDGVFHWRPLTLADKLQAWSAVDMLLGTRAESSDMIFTMEFIKHEESEESLCRVLGIVALHGYVNIANIFCGTKEASEIFARDSRISRISKNIALVWDVQQHFLDSEKTSAFITSKVRLETKDSDYRTPLSWAPVKGRLETVKFLVENGQMLTQSMPGGKPVFNYAIRGCHMNVVLFLGESGVNVNAYKEYGHSPLSTAVQQDNVHIVKFLMHQGADVNACSKYSDSPISAAVEGGNVDIVRFLMDKGAHINACNRYGESPIFAAVEQGNVDIAELLMNKGTIVNAYNKYGESLILAAVQERNVDIVKLIMDKGVDINAYNRDGKSLIHAVMICEVDIVRLLIDKGPDVNACNENGTNPICAAAEKSNVDVVRLLIDEGAYFDACNRYAKSPIFLALKNGYVEIIRFLMDKAVDVNACNKNGDSQIFAAAEQDNVDTVRLLMDEGADVNACNKNGDSPIFAAAEQGNVDIVRLLMDKGADVNACNTDGKTPIFAAVEESIVDMVRFLIAENADVTACNKNGDSLIFIAVQRDNMCIVSLLIDTGADVDAFNKIGDSSILAAVQQGNAVILRLLLDKGADVDAFNKNGDSSLLAAVQEGYVDIVTVVMDKGADANACDNV